MLKVLVSLYSGAFFNKNQKAVNYDKLADFAVINIKVKYDF